MKYLARPYDNSYTLGFACHTKYIESQNRIGPAPASWGNSGQSHLQLPLLAVVACQHGPLAHAKSLGRVAFVLLAAHRD